jgi:WD40 repeat protein
MQLDKDNPWPGLESFEEDAHSYFFGRDHEIKLLQDHVLDSPVTVLYGCSGLGKTSVLQAGLFPVLRERHFLPIYIRFELKPGAPPLCRQLQHAVRDSIRAEVPDALLPSDAESLWEYLHRNDFELWSRRNYPLTPVIVLDQFEEMFTVGERVPDLVREFRDDLGDLAENRIPAELAARIEGDEGVAAQFQLRSRKYKILISLREDYLPDLEGWRQLIPALGRSRVRLLHLQASDALAAVHNPAAHLMTVDLARRVVAIVAGEDLNRGRDAAQLEVERAVDDLEAANVEPALLSLFCRELNEERKRRRQPQFDEQLIEDASRNILSNYYSSCVRDLDPRVARFIESELITEKGFRNSYIREDAVPAHLTEDELDRLIRSRLVRLEDRYGAPRIELTHDVLTRAVREHRDRHRAEEENAALSQAAELARASEQAAQAQAAAEQQAKLKAQEQAQVLLKRTRVLYATLALVVVAALVAVGAFGWGHMKKRDADRAARDATAVGLFGDSQLMLAGLSRSGGHDVTAIQEMLAAHAIRSKHEGKYELLTALNLERDLLKIIDLPQVVTTVAFSPDGTRIAAGSAEKTVWIWDTDGKLIGQPLQHDDAVTSVAFSPDGTRIATGSADKTVRLWDTDGKPIGQPLQHDDAVTSVAFSPDGTRIATGSADKTVRLWDTDGKPIGQPLQHEGWVNAVAIGPNGTIAVACADKTVRLWDTDGKSIGQPLQHDDAVMSVAFSPDGTRIATGSYDKTIRLWDTATWQPVGQPLRGHEAAVRALAFGPDSLHLVSSGGNDATVRIWDVRSWEPMLGHDDTTWAAFYDGGRRIASGSSDKTVRWWDATTGRPMGEPLRVDDSDVVSLYPVDEDRVMSIGSTDTVRLWDAHTRKPIGEPLRLPPNPDRVLASDKTGRRIAAVLDSGAVQLYDTNPMRPVGQPIREEQPISAVEFSRDGEVAATGSKDGTIRLWDSDTGAPIGRPMKGKGYVTSAAFSDDSHRIAVGYMSYSLQLWNTDTFQPVGQLMGLDSIASGTAFSPDGHTLASGGDDGTIQLWDADDQSAMGAPFTGHTTYVTSLEFSPDGTKLLSASGDHTIRAWPVPARSLEAARDALCAKLTHNMSRDQWNEWVSPQIDYIKACPNLPDSDYSE